MNDYERAVQDLEHAINAVGAVDADDSDILEKLEDAQQLLSDALEMSRERA